MIEGKRMIRWKRGAKTGGGAEGETGRKEGRGRK